MFNYSSYHTDYYTAVQLRVYATRTFSLHPHPATVPYYTIRILSSTQFPIIATFLTPEVTAVHVFPLTALRSPSSPTAARVPRRRRHNYYLALPRPPARLDPLSLQHSTNRSHITVSSCRTILQTQPAPAAIRTSSPLTLQQLSCSLPPLYSHLTYDNAQQFLSNYYSDNPRYHSDFLGVTVSSRFSIRYPQLKSPTWPTQPPCQDGHPTQRQ